MVKVVNYLKKSSAKRIKGLILILVLLILTVFVLDNAAKTVYPVKYKAYVVKYSDKYKLDPFLVFAVIKAESGFRPDAVSSSNAKGLMQLTEGTGKWAAGKIGLKNYKPDKLMDPETNIMLGCWYLNSLLKEFGQDQDKALAAYNAGSGNVKQWLQEGRLSKEGTELSGIPFRETENYLKRVKKYYNVYQKLYAGGL